MPLSPGTRLGAYEVTGSLGAGGMGEVYRARDTRLDRTVAIERPFINLASSTDPRFLSVMDPLLADSSPRSMIVVLNWFEELKARAPVRPTS